MKRIKSLKTINQTISRLKSCLSVVPEGSDLYWALHQKLGAAMLRRFEIIEIEAARLRVE